MSDLLFLTPKQAKQEVEHHNQNNPRPKKETLRYNQWVRIFGTNGTIFKERITFYHNQRRNRKVERAIDGYTRY